MIVFNCNAMTTAKAIRVWAIDRRRVDLGQLHQIVCGTDKAARLTLCGAAMLFIFSDGSALRWLGQKVEEVK